MSKQTPIFSIPVASHEEPTTPAHLSHQPSVMNYFFCFLICIFIARLYLLAMLDRDPDFSQIQRFFFLSQDAVLCLLYLALLYLLSFARRWIHYASVLIHYFNLLMVFAASEAKLYPTLEEINPKNWTGATTLAQDYASWERVLLLSSSLVIFLYGPKFCHKIGQFLQIIASAFNHIIIYMLLIYSIGIFLFLSPPFKALQPQNQPIYEILDQWLGEDHLFVDQANPKSLDQMAVELQKIKHLEPLDPLYSLRYEVNQKGKNVILVVLESTGYQRFLKVLQQNPSFLGNQPKMSFTAHHTTVPHSASSLHAIFCGRPRIPKESFEEYLRACRSLPAYLKSQQVSTALFQSSFFGDWIPKEFFENFGFDEIHDSQSIAQLAEARKEKAEINGQYAQEWQTVKEVLHWSKTQCLAQKKFFTAYYSWVAHAPYPLNHLTPHRYEKYKGIKDENIRPEERYELLLMTLDDQIKTLWEGIKASPCGKDTILVITGDHGEAFDDHFGNLYHSAYPYQENIHIPFFILSPIIEEQPKLAVEIAIPTSHTDLNATIAHFVLGKETPLSSDFSRDLVQKINPRPIISLSMMNRGMVSMRWGNLKMIRNRKQSLVFDLDQDPLEKQDLSTALKRQTQSMKDLSHHWMSYTKQEIFKRPNMKFEQAK